LCRFFNPHIEFIDEDMTDETGTFYIKGVADKKHLLNKVIIEGYRFDPETGETVWAIDKKETGKSAYRVKMQRRSMETDLVMFNSRETTLFNLLEPRSLTYMTRIHLYDGRRDAPPEHYWYSRIDTRDSIISSIYTEPGTRLKLTLSDTVLTNKMILTNGSEENKLGLGYLVDDYPSIPNTIYHSAQDAWTLLVPRIDNLETHGISWRGKYRFGNIPLVNYLPDFLRQRLCPHARTYTRGDIRRLFEGLEVEIVVLDSGDDVDHEVRNFLMRGKAVLDQDIGALNLEALE